MVCTNRFILTVFISCSYVEFMRYILFTLPFALGAYQKCATQNWLWNKKMGLYVYVDDFKLQIFLRYKNFPFNFD